MDALQKIVVHLFSYNKRIIWHTGGDAELISIEEVAPYKVYFRFEEM